MYVVYRLFLFYVNFHLLRVTLVVAIDIISFKEVNVYKLLFSPFLFKIFYYLTFNEEVTVCG